MDFFIILLYFYYYYYYYYLITSYFFIIININYYCIVNCPHPSSRSVSNNMNNINISSYPYNTPQQTDDLDFSKNVVPNRLCL